MSYQNESVKAEVDTGLFQVSEAVNMIALVEKKIEEITSTVLVIGVTDSRGPISGMTMMGMAARDNLDQALGQLFTVRSRLTQFRTTL